VAILFICSAYCWFISQRSGNIMGYLGWFSMAWVFSLLAAGICFVCRLVQLIKRDSFTYIFISAVSFSLSLFGITMVDNRQHLVSIWGLLLFVGVLIGALMLADIYIFEILTPKKWKE
jgi:hypothetical protein